MSSHESRAGGRFDVVVPDYENGDPHPVQRKDRRWTFSTVALFVSAAVALTFGTKDEATIMIAALAWVAGWLVGKYLSYKDTSVSTNYTGCTLSPRPIGTAPKD